MSKWEFQTSYEAGLDPDEWHDLDEWLDERIRDFVWTDMSDRIFFRKSRTNVGDQEGKIPVMKQYKILFGDKETDWMDVQNRDVYGLSGLDVRCVKFRDKPVFSPGYFRKKSAGNQGSVEWWNVDPGVNYERVNVVISLG